MVDFSILKNEQLRTLAMSSPALATLADPQKEEMVGKFAGADQDDQAFYVSIFEKEQQELAQLDQTWAGDLQQAAAQVDEASKELDQVKRQYEASVRTMLEARSQAEDNKHSEEILLQLQSL